MQRNRLARDDSRQRAPRPGLAPGVENGAATLRGSVSTRTWKRLAADIADASRDDSELRIQRHDDAPGDERGMTGERLSVKRRQV